MATDKPRNTSASIRQWLLNHSTAIKTDPNPVLIWYGLERFLYRLSVSTTASDSCSKAPCFFACGAARLSDRAKPSSLAMRPVMSPFSGEGVNNPMLDAAELARLLAGPAPWADAVSEFEALMFARVIESAEGPPGGGHAAVT
jgi:hypothetical protein